MSITAIVAQQYPLQESSDLALSANQSILSNCSPSERDSESSGNPFPATANPYLNIQRSGEITVAAAIDMYMAAYQGRDKTRASRMLFWRNKMGNLTLNEVDSDHIHFELEKLSTNQARYWAGTDADGKPIFKSKGKPYAPATINRYAASISALFTWCIRKRLTPKKWEHPCKGVERRPENNELTRFLSDSERTALLSSCKESKWKKLYLLVLMGLTTGARKGELLSLKWGNIDFDRKLAYLEQTKNGDSKTLPLLPQVVAELCKHKAENNKLIFASQKCPNQAFNFVPSWTLALKKAKVRNFRFHDLRHSCASFLAQNGATLLEIGDVLGHRQISVTKRYSHLTVTHKANLINRLFVDIQ